MNYFQLLSKVANNMDEENIPYHFIKSTALWIQGVEIDHSNKVFLEVQWDVFEKVYTLFAAFPRTEVDKSHTTASFYVQYEDFTIFVQCSFNTTIRTHPYRVKIEKDGAEFWCISIYHYLLNRDQDSEDNLIRDFLKKQQQEMTDQNEEAWNQHNYEALLNRHGNPSDLAEKIKQNPRWRLHPFYKYFDDVSDKKVLHLMGSNGIKGVALSLLGAHVTIVDFSKENQSFALELAQSAEVSLQYIVSDILALPSEIHQTRYDYILMELGVLHYFIDLLPVMQTISSLLLPGGKFILHEFHPISTKLITSSGKKHKVTGNYFDPTISRREVAFTKHISDEAKKNSEYVLQRKWTLGEVITSIGQAGLVTEVLEEEPNHKIHDIGLPKTFTIVARKI